MEPRRAFQRFAASEIEIETPFAPASKRSIAPIAAVDSQYRSQ
jgi:hypothetical protein